MDKHKRFFSFDTLLLLGCWLSFLTITAFFFWLMGNVFFNGIQHISWDFLVKEPLDAGRSGGIGTILVSTFLILLICLSVCLPIGICTAIFLAEFTATESKVGRLIRLSLEVLAGVPSIVFGLFGNAFFCIYFKMGFSILSGGLTLACMILPFFIRSAEEGFRAIPSEYRLSAFALGMTRSQALFHLLFPLALPGLLIGLVLGIGRALAETAALMFTSGYVTRMPESLFDSGRTLSIHIYDLSMQVPGGESQAYATALILVVFLFFINGIVTLLSKHWFQKHLVQQD